MTTPNEFKHPKRRLEAARMRSRKSRQLDDAAEPQQVLRFTPWAWAKLQFFCHHGDTEIGGFGITSGGDLLLVEDVVTVKQKTTCVSVAFDDEAVADFFEAQVDAGRKPGQFARIWAHTHPGNSPNPSSTDEETFNRVFGACDWSVMFILARGGETYARLRFGVGPKGHLLIPVSIDYSAPFNASAHDAWELEYETNIHAVKLPQAGLDPAEFDGWDWDGGLTDELDPTVEAEFLRQFEDMEFDECRLEEGEVIR